MAEIEPKPRARLFFSDDNPVPEGAKVGHLKTSDGIAVRYARWEAELRPSKGTVLLLHGRSECIEKYFETVSDLRKRGFGVLTFDWRGQGGSDRMLRDRKKGHVENFNQYLTDFETILTEIVLPDCKPPHYILAHSTGSLVALLAAPALSNRIRRMVLVSPLLRLNQIPFQQSTLQRVLGVLTFFGLGRFYLARNLNPNRFVKFISNRLTSDTKRFARNRDIVSKYPQLAVSHPTIAWVFAACRAMTRVTTSEYSNAIAIPTLLIAAGSDTVVSPAEIEAFGKRMRTGAFLTISGAKHEILQERDVYREQLLAAFDAFVPGTEI